MSTVSITTNRAYRRAAQKAKRRRERHQAREDDRRHPLFAEMFAPHCQRCNLRFFGPASARCQCQVQQKHRCTCGYDVIASQSEWRSTSFCARCADQLREQWENEEESRGEAIARLYEMQEEIYE